MKFFSLGLHIGIKDLQCIFEELGHSLDIWSLSDHNFVMSWETPHVDVINKANWWNLNVEMCDAFYARYKNELDKYDGFVCFYPPSFSLLYEKFNKPIIIQVPLRYEIQFLNDFFRWNWFNEYLLRNFSEDKKNILVVNNKYDQLYMKLFLGKEFSLISSLCDYTNAEYSGRRKEFLYCSKLKISDFADFIKVSNIIDKSTIKNYSWQDIVDFKALIYIPYSNTNMSVFEQYASNIPLLFPSKDFLIHLRELYWNKGVMSECSWRQIFNLPQGSVIKYKNDDFDDIPDPNDYRSLESFSFWSKLSDFYDDENLPYIEHFDSIGELEYKLITLDFSEISDNMKKFNIERKKRILGKWSELLQKIC